MPMMPNDFARSSGRVTSAMYAWASDRLPAVAPSMARARKRTQRLGANAVM